MKFGLNRKFNVLLAATCLIISGSLMGCNKTDDKLGDYTYNTYLSTNPKTWNSHNWETSDESYVTAYTEMGFYDTQINANKDGYEIVSEMADGDPVLVEPANLDSEEYSKISEKYYDGGNLLDNAIYDIKLNQLAKWEDGTPIKADDYVESMKLLLDPKYANYRADSFYKGDLVVANAEKYFKQGRETVESAFDYLDLSSGNFKDPSSAGTNGMYYLNLGSVNGYVSSVVGSSSEGSDFTYNLYTFFNNFSGWNNAGKLAYQRVEDAVFGFLLRGFQSKTYYTEHQAFYDTKKSDWEEAVSKGVSGVTSSMIFGDNLVMPDINFDDFTNPENVLQDGKGALVVRKKLDNSNLEADGNSQNYSRALLEADLRTIMANAPGNASYKQNWSWKCLAYIDVYNNDSVAFDNVGFAKVDDYTIRFYLTRDITLLDLKFSLTSNFLVNTKLYTENTIETASGTKQTTYATNMEDYMSYGPYKMYKYESGKNITLIKNENWYGYTDGKHVGQYQMTSLVTQIITDHDTAMGLFLKGQLDDITLDNKDMKDYGTSSRKTVTYESYTTKISFNTNRNKLLERQKAAGSGLNKTVLSNYNFRKGLSLGIDRNTFAAQATGGSKAFTGLLNDLYLTNAETGAKYRDTKQGKSVYNTVYGNLGGNTLSDTKDENGAYQPAETKALSESQNGYNKALAEQYVTKAIKDEVESKEEGHLTASDKISIEFKVYDNQSDTTTAAQAQLNNYFTDLINASNAANGYTNSIEITLTKDENYYDSAKVGNYDMIFSTWGGASINPYGLMEVYCSSTFDSNCEYGFKGKQNSTPLTITFSDGSQETKSFDAWYNEMANTLTSDQTERRLDILAGLEAGIIDRFEAIPLVARGTTSLTSFKVENYSNSYISLVGYGGVRQLSFNYTNSQWADVLKQNGNDLTNEYKD